MSNVSLPAVFRPWPFGHVLHSVQDVSALVPFLKCSASHAVHVASAVLSAEFVKYLPGGHSVVFTEHEVLAFVSVLCSEGAHAVHVASAVLSPEAV